jgi:steroid delta-isomerase-like uncharacterized protein
MTMTPALVALFERRQGAFDNGDAAAFAADYADDCFVESPMSGTQRGPAAVELGFRRWFAAFPDTKIRVEKMFGDGDDVTQVLMIEGTDTGGFLGFPPTGQPFRLPGVFLYALRDGRISHERRTYDFARLLLQLAGQESAVESGRLYGDTLDRARLQHEIKIAAAIQQQLLPEGRYVRGGIEVSAASIPGRSIGGDFFDYFSEACDDFGFVLGDVAGKGPPAALLAAMMQGMLAAHVKRGGTPCKLLKEINETLVRRMIESAFVTAFFASLTKNGVLTYCNAGHNPPILIGDAGLRRLETGGSVLGAFPDTIFDEEKLQLETGDVLIVYSDGVTEALDAQDEEFGDERLVSCVKANRQRSPDELLRCVLDTVRDFSCETNQRDDMTVVVLRYVASQ